MSAPTAAPVEPAAMGRRVAVLGGGSDAWVAVLGAPMSTGASSRTFSRESQKAQSVAPTTSSDGESGFAYHNNKAKPIPEEGA